MRMKSLPAFALSKKEKSTHIMARKQKKPLTAEQRRARRKRRRETMVVFIHGKQKRVPRPPTIDGVAVEEFIRHNADPIWLHQNEMWEYIHDRETSQESPQTQSSELWEGEDYTR